MLVALSISAIRNWKYLRYSYAIAQTFDYIIFYLAYHEKTKQFLKITKEDFNSFNARSFLSSLLFGPKQSFGEWPHDVYIRWFLHRPHDIYICHRTYNILDLAVVQINFIFTVAVANRMFLEVIVSQSIVSFPQNVLLYKETMATSTEAKQHWY